MRSASPLTRAWLALALLTAACSPTARSVPRYDDVAGYTRVVASLSPWKDGSPDRSRNHDTWPEGGSDRYLFRLWFQRYSQHEESGPYEKHYVPFDVPATVADAIDVERKLQAKQEATEIAFSNFAETLLRSGCGDLSERERSISSGSSNVERTASYWNARAADFRRRCDIELAEQSAHAAAERQRSEAEQAAQKLSAAVNKQRKRSVTRPSKLAPTQRPASKLPMRSVDSRKGRQSAPPCEARRTPTPPLRQRGQGSTALVNTRSWHSQH